MHATIQHCYQGFDHLRPHTGKTFRQGIGAQQQRRPDLPLFEQLTNAGGVAAQEIDLELLEFIGRYPDFAELAETGRHAIDDGTIFQGAVYDPAGGGRSTSRLWRKGDLRVIAGDPRDGFQRQRVAVDYNPAHNCSGLSGLGRSKSESLGFAQK
jgi:hypothetical protein